MANASNAAVKWMQSYMQYVRIECLLSKSFDEIVCVVEPQLTGFAEVGHTAGILAEENVGEAAIVVGFGQVWLQVNGFVVADNGSTIVL